MRIVPGRGAEEASFGQTAAEIHAIVGAPTRRVRNIEQTSDGWNLHYDADDRLGPKSVLRWSMRARFI